ncbi:paired box' domain protein [Dictyocaulus viviparus]|uniref:Paired box' domain protein n=1 Tax=Dictyocaulus viviparus TaxID=29172 RepID=A0A0D8XW06_DICVI|nr:paired box' domain protein [Dictyocaulus viviparus]
MMSYYIPQKEKSLSNNMNEFSDEGIEKPKAKIICILNLPIECLKNLPIECLKGMAPSVSNTYYTSSEAPRLTTELSEDNDVLPETVIDSAKRDDVRKPRRKGTNLYGRPYCPGRPLSMVERRRIIDLHMSGMKVNAISKALCISHGCVSKIISRYRQTGILSPASSPEQRRTRRKKNESPSSATSLVDLHEYKPEFKHDYTHSTTVADYTAHDFRLHYATTTPSHGVVEMAAMQHYTMLPEQMLMQEYPQSILL